jgi:hypothetical protein
MKQFSKILKIFMCIFPSVYLTYTFAQNILLSIPQIIFIFSYFIIVGLLCLLAYNTFLQKKVEIKSKKIGYAVSFTIAIFILILFGNQLVPKPYDPFDISIEAANEKNRNSQGNEVWISQININGLASDLSNIKLSPGWQYKPDSNTIYANLSDQITPLNLKIDKAKAVELSFVKHAWSGTIIITDKEEKEIIDLYDQNGDTYTYTAKAHVRSITLLPKIILFFSLGMLLYDLCIVLFHFIHWRLKKNS